MRLVQCSFFEKNYFQKNYMRQKSGNLKSNDAEEEYYKVLMEEIKSKTRVTME